MNRERVIRQGTDLVGDPTGSKVGTGPDHPIRHSTHNPAKNRSDSKKSELITWLAGLPDDSQAIQRIDVIRTGAWQVPFAGEGRALEISEATRRAGVSRSLLYRAVHAGSLRCFIPYPGGHRKITEAELDRWLQGNKKAEARHA